VGFSLLPGDEYIPLLSASVCPQRAWSMSDRPQRLSSTAGSFPRKASNVITGWKCTPLHRGDIRAIAKRTISPRQSRFTLGSPPAQQHRQSSTLAVFY
jgi:hypothetical protein